MEQKTVPDIFISYSRKDIAFAKLIRESLIESRFNVWIDWERIPTGVEWWPTIEAAIKDSNTFMFIISKTSIASPVCKDEIALALQNNKRIIPVIVDDLSPEAVGEFVPDLRKINWIIFQRDHIFHIEVNPGVQSERAEDREVALPGKPQYEQALEKLSREIQTDWEWVTYHTRLQTDALRWSAGGQHPSSLLRGMLLEEAERKLLEAGGKDPAPTLLQSQFVTTSRLEETHRQATERALEQKAARRQRLFLWAVGVGLLIAFGLMLLFLNQRDQYLAETFVRATAQSNAESAQSTAVSESNARATQEAIAIDQRNVALNRQLAAQARNLAGRTLDAGLLLAIEAGRASNQPDVQNTLLDVLQVSPALLHYIPGHPHGFSQVSVSPDGKLLAAGTVDYTVQLYDLSSGMPVGSPLTGPPSEVMAVAFSPDGRTLAAACNDPQIFFWDISDPAHPKPLPTLSMEMSSVQETASVNSNGKVFTTWTGRYLFGLNGLWNNYSDSPQEDARVNSFGAFSLRYSPDGSLLAVGVGDGSVRLLDVKAGNWMDRLPMLSNLPGLGLNLGYVFNLTFSRDGHILVASAGISVRAWDVSKKTLLNERDCFINNGQLYLPAAVDPSGQRMVFFCNTVNPDGTTNPTLRIIDLQGNQDDVEQVLPAQPLSIAFDPAGQPNLVALGTTDNSVLLWNLATGQAVGEPLRAHNSEVVSVQFTPDGTQLVSADWNHNLVVWALEPSGQANRLASRVTLPTESENQFSDQVSGLTFSPDGGKLFLARGVSSNLYLADLASNQPVRAVAATVGDSTYILKVAYLPGLNAVTWLQNDGKVVLLDPVTFQVQRTFIAANDPGSGSAVANSDEYTFDPAGLRLANVAKGEVRLWDLQTGQQLPQKLSLTDISFSSPVFSPDGSLLALRGQSDQDQSDTLYLWQPASGKVTSLALTTGSGNGYLVVAISPDNRSLAYSRLDKNFYLCNLETGTPVCQPGGSNTTWIGYLAFNHAGTLLASLSSDGALRLWDTAGKAVGSLPAPNGYFSFVWSQDDRRLAILGNSGTVVLFDANLLSWSETACRLAGRNLSLAEWQAYFPGQAYRKTCPDQPLHPSVVESFLVTQASVLADNQMDAALTAFARELPLEASLLPELKAAAAAFLPQALGLRAVYLSNRDPSAALAAAGEIKALYGTPALDADLWNAICWNGSLYGQPAAALPFCEAALQLDPGNPNYLDSRGLGRALTGDFAGAAADFKVFVEATKKDGRYDLYGKLREGWIVLLEKGQNPFDAATIEALKKE